MSEMSQPNIEPVTPVFEDRRGGTNAMGTSLANTGRRSTDPNYDSELWRPRYGANEHGRFDRELCIARLDRMTPWALDAGATPEDIEQSRGFIYHAFDAFARGPAKGDPEVSHAFVVPLRTSGNDGRRSSDGGFSSEVRDFMPITGFVGPTFTERLATALPPTIIERYQVDADGRQGIVVYTPISPDLKEAANLYGSNIAIQKMARSAITGAVTLASKHGAEVVGLGATIPALTNFGRSILLSNSELRVTTGHAGTAQLILETVRAAESQLTEHNGVYGLIGCGSIGQGIARMLHDLPGESKVAIYDINESNTQKIIKQLGGDRVISASSAEDVLAQANLIVSAVTNDFTLPEGDYTGKVIVEDSMPTHAPYQTVERGGGHVVWVIGDDVTADGILTPIGGYTFGDSFAAVTNTFGCSAEVAVIAQSHDYDALVSGPVTLDKITRIGQLFKQYGIASAGLQRNGTYISELR